MVPHPSEVHRSPQLLCTSRILWMSEVALMIQHSSEVHSQSSTSRASHSPSARSLGRSVLRSLKRDQIVHKGLRHRGEPSPPFQSVHVHPFRLEISLNPLSPFRGGAPPSPRIPPARGAATSREGRSGSTPDRGGSCSHLARVDRNLMKLQPTLLRPGEGGGGGGKRETG